MTETARALYFEAPRTVALRERQVPTPAADEVLVETTHSGISAGTELLVYRDEVPDGMAVDATLDSLDGTFEYPLQYGYAAVGQVAATGAAVDDDWLGRRVFGFNPHESHFCAAPGELRVVPEGIDAAAATLFPTAETALTLVLDAAPLAGERVVVHGAGVVGLAVTALLSQFPLESLTVVDPVSTRREHATSMGATETLAPAETDRLGDRGEPPGMDLAIEVSGNPEALDDAVHAVGFDGRVVVGSWYGDRRAELDLGGHFHRSRIDVSASQVSTVDPSLRGRWTRARRLDRAVDIVDQHDLGSLVSHRIPFSDAPDAYDLIARRDDVCHVVFRYD